MNLKIQPMVLDTSVSIKWFLKEPYEEQSLKLREAFRKGLCRLIAPDLIYPEFANTIWKRVVFHGLDLDEGEWMITAFKKIPIEVIPSKNLLNESLHLAFEYRRPIYDCLFLASSIQTGAHLITADEKLYRAIRASFPTVVWIGDYHSA